ncbi:MAG UNVERIFIED_CONTAM: hypothetical protein LVR29_18535 [Microcystis novacekii LVE1205-3]|jgi:WD40 repeat protein
MKRDNGFLPSVKTISGHSASVLDVKFSPDGQQIASASADGTIKNWQLRGYFSDTFQALGLMLMPSSLVEMVKLLSQGNSNKTIIIWDLTHNLTSKICEVDGCHWLKDYLQHNSRWNRVIVVFVTTFSVKIIKLKSS